jgi:L-amino acid N-acyltransferase YncA
MTDLLNEIIAIGGTTAHETAMTAATVQAHYIDGPGVITSVVAEEAGDVIGWQAVGLWQGDAHIGTFVKPGVQAKGIGGGLFALTREMAAKAGVTRIMASLRTDNVPGLAYYARAGFVDCGHEPEFALQDGRVVGRWLRQFDLV